MEPCGGRATLAALQTNIYVSDMLQNGYKPSAYLMLSGLWCHDKRLVGQFIVVVLVGRDADRLGPRPVLSVDDGLKEPSGIGLV